MNKSDNIDGNIYDHIDDIEKILVYNQIDISIESEEFKNQIKETKEKIKFQMKCSFKLHEYKIRNMNKQIKILQNQIIDYQQFMQKNIEANIDLCFAKNANYTASICIMRSSKSSLATNERFLMRFL